LTSCAMLEPVSLTAHAYQEELTAAAYLHPCNRTENLGVGCRSATNISVVNEGRGGASAAPLSALAQNHRRRERFGELLGRLRFELWPPPRLGRWRWLWLRAVAVGSDLAVRL